MSVLVFAELDNGSIKKSSLEAIYYGSEVAKAWDSINALSQDCRVYVPEYDRIISNKTFPLNAFPIEVAVDGEERFEISENLHTYLETS